MPLHDYSEDDDFYEQDFERKGVLSIWLSSGVDSGVEGADVLQDLCGVGYYRLDDQEANARPDDTTLEVLLGEISYSGSFIKPALQAASRMQVTSARWAVVQFDFAYDPSRVRRAISPGVLFLGVFAYAVS